MSKQGFMVFHINIGSNGTITHMEYLQLNRKLKKEIPELYENYDILFIPHEDGECCKIDMFPYKDYKFNIEDMTVGEIENYLETEILSKLHRP